MRVRFIVLLVLLFPFILTAATPTSANLSWTRATTLIDGTAIPAANHKETWIRWYRAASPTVTVGEVRAPSPATSTVVTGLVCGDYSFEAYTVLVGDVTSGPTGPVVKATGVACTPNPPTGLSAT